jgi:C-terminal processing protease CtpA/Prc
LVDSGNGYFLWQDESYLGFIEPTDIQFTGTVYVLTDGRNYSASTDFTSLASRLDIVFIVGEETGGEYRSYISGAMFGLVLPNSKIGVKIPTWKTILAVEEDKNNRGRGVIPDYPVSISLDDFINGKDAVKSFAFELISSGQQ